MPNLKLSVNENRCMGTKYFVGRVAVYDGDMYLYSHSCGVSRLTKEDAMDDAKWLKRDLLDN